MLLPAGACANAHSVIGYVLVSLCPVRSSADHVCSCRLGPCALPSFDRLCHFVRRMGRIVFIHANGQPGVRGCGNGGAARGHCCVGAAAFGLGAQSAGGHAGALARYCRGRVVQCRDSVCVLCLCAAPYSHGAVVHPQCHDAAVYSRGGVGVAGAKARPMAGAGLGRRFFGGGVAGSWPREGGADGCVVGSGAAAIAGHGGLPVRYIVLRPGSMHQP